MAIGTTQRVVSVIGAVVAAVGGGLLLWGAIQSAWYMYELLSSTDSGGLGAVSAGIGAETLLVMVAGPLLALFANRRLRGWARSAAPSTRLVHRMHSMALVLMLAAMVLTAAIVFSSPESVGLFLWIGAGVSLAAIAGLQYLLLSLLLTLFARS
jgi:hypothetical protein